MSIRRITFAFPAVISYNKATCGAFEKLRSELGYIKNIQIEVRFHVGASYGSLAPTYFICQSALTPLLLLSKQNQLTLGFGLGPPCVRLFSCRF